MDGLVGGGRSRRSGLGRIQASFCPTNHRRSQVWKKHVTESFPCRGFALCWRVFPPCPYLPSLRVDLDWRALHQHRQAERGADFYFDCLRYGQSLWSRGLAARALLCLDRAFGANLDGPEAVLKEWPLPYAATGWIIHHTPPGVFIGNPRVHFQHYADRLRAPRREQRRARAWACWAIARAVRPEFPADPRHDVHEPSHDEIAAALRAVGHAGEAELWSDVLKLYSLPDNP